MHTLIRTPREGSARRALGAALALLVVLSFVGFLAGCGGKSADSGEATPPAATTAEPAPAATPPATEVALTGTPEERGKAQFSKCIQCHKADGSGGVKLTGNATPSWTDKARMKTITDAELHDCIFNGKLPSGMVAWGKSGQLNEQQIGDLIAYIRTFAK